MINCLGMMRVVSSKLCLTATCLPRLRGRDIASIVQMCRDSMFGHPLADQDCRLNLILKSNIGTLLDEDLFLLWPKWLCFGIERSSDWSRGDMLLGLQNISFSDFLHLYMSWLYSLYFYSPLPFYRKRQDQMKRHSWFARYWAWGRRSRAVSHEVNIQ